MAIGKTTEELFAEQYPNCSMENHKIVYDSPDGKCSMSLKTVFNLMWLHNMSVDDVVNELKSLALFIPERRVEVQ